MQISDFYKTQSIKNKVILIVRKTMLKLILPKLVTCFELILNCINSIPTI